MASKVRTAKKKVQFHLPPTVIPEPNNIFECLPNISINNYQSQILDKLRMEKMLAPVFCPIKRLEIYKTNIYQLT
jgi:hypothetical protein